MSQDQVAAYLSQTADVIASIETTALAAAVDAVRGAWERDATVYICGNGGSASTASHMACDLSKQTMVAGRRPLRAMALTDNVELISAWGNDADFSRVFAEQLNIHSRPGDVLVAISASGNSHNIIRAVEEARRQGIKVIGLTGFDGGRLAEMSDVHVHVPSSDYGHVESAHVAVEHCLTSLLSATAWGPRAELARKPLVILDRDGVINRNLADGVRRWEDFEFLPGVLEALEDLHKNGHPVAVVTNQANVGRGHLTLAQLNDIHHRMLDAVVAGGGQIASVHVCHHRPEEGCDCRKPRPGLLLEAIRRHRADADSAYLVGDHATDILAARAAGVKSVLVMSGRHVDRDLMETPSLVARDLRQAARMIVEAHEAVQQAAELG